MLAARVQLRVQPPEMFEFFLEYLAARVQHVDQYLAAEGNSGSDSARPGARALQALIRLRRRWLPHLSG